MKKSVISRLTALLAVGTVLTAGLTGSFALPSAAASQAELESRLNDLKDQEKTLRGKIDSYGDDLDSAQAKQDAIYAQVANTQEQIDIINDKISLLEREMDGKNQEIADREAVIEQKRAENQAIYDRLRARLRSIAKSGTVSSLQMLLNTENYGDYLLKSKIVEVVSDKDQREMDAVEAEIRAIQDEEVKLNADRAELGVQVADIERLRAEVEVKKTELDNLYAAAKAETDKIQSNIDNYESELKKTRREMDKLEEQIKEIIRKNTGNTTGDSFLSGTMYWPCPGCTVVTSGFGARWGTTHRGVDLARYGTAYGQEIVAAYDGEVIYVNSSGYGGGYGLYVIVDHGTDAAGRNICTLYAHMSTVYAKKGDRVTGGKSLIGLVGSTGNSTGPHLHFEVRVEGTAVDPFSNGYITKP